MITLGLGFYYPSGAMAPDTAPPAPSVDPLLQIRTNVQQAALNPFTVMTASAQNTQNVKVTNPDGSTAAGGEIGPQTVFPAAIVGLSPKAKSVILWGGGILAALYLLKRLI